MKAKIHVAVVVSFQIVLCLMISQIADHCDYVPWGKHSSDGLDFLTFPFIYWPLLLALSLADIWAYADRGYSTFTYLIELVPVCMVSHMGASGTSLLQLISILLLIGVVISNCLLFYRQSTSGSSEVA